MVLTLLEGTIHPSIHPFIDPSIHLSIPPSSDVALPSRNRSRFFSTSVRFVVLSLLPGRWPMAVLFCDPLRLLLSTYAVRRAFLKFDGGSVTISHNLTRLENLVRRKGWEDLWWLEDEDTLG